MCESRYSYSQWNRWAVEILWWAARYSLGRMYMYMVLSVLCFLWNNTRHSLHYKQSPSFLQVIIIHWWLTIFETLVQFKWHMGLALHISWLLSYVIVIVIYFAFHIHLCRHGISQSTGCFKKSFTTLKAYRNLYRVGQFHSWTKMTKKDAFTSSKTVHPLITLEKCASISTPISQVGG